MRFEVSRQQNASSFSKELPDVAAAEVSELGSLRLRSGQAFRLHKVTGEAQ
jgi:hypothetical protein